jgi:hypothetical protein
MNIEGLILKALPSVEIELFDDAQFHQEPRLALIQRAFHDLRRQKDTWMAMGMMGAKARVTAHRGPYLAEMLARAKLPRANLHPRHDVQIRTAQTLAQDLVTVVNSLGTMCAQTDVPASGLMWCGLAEEDIQSRLQIVGDKVWLTMVYDPIKDAHNPINRVALVQPRHSTQPVTGLFWCMEVPSQRAAYRIQEIAELGHWALRQPKYTPQAS